MKDRNHKSLSVGIRNIGPGEKPFVIAEVAQAHDGSLGLAHAFIEVAAYCGADAVKFQTHIASAESTLDEKFRIPLSGQDETRYAYWKRMEFTAEQWLGLSDHARASGLTFLSSAFSTEAVELLRKLRMPAWKVGSGEYKSKELLGAMMDAGGAIFLSSGMSTYSEIGDIVSLFRARGVEFGIFQCTSRYPTRLEEVGLNVISELKQMFQCPVGLSDHSGSACPALAALSRGADMVEVHLTLHRAMYGPDVSASVTPDELALICRMRDAIWIMDSNPVDKDNAASGLGETRTLFTKSIAPAHFVKAGTVVTRDALRAKKPGTGIPFDDLEKVIGLTLVRDVMPDRLLSWADLENPNA